MTDTNEPVSIDWSVPDQWHGDATQVRERAKAPFGLPVAKVVLKVMTAVTTVGVVLIVISFGLIAVAAGRSIAGVPLTLDIESGAALMEPGTHAVLPLVVTLGVIALAMALGGSTGHSIAKPHGEAKAYTQEALIWSAAALIVAPLMGLAVALTLNFLLNVVAISMFPELVGLLYPADPLRVTIS